MPDPRATSSIFPAPGARAARLLGILAIVFALTCVGFPVAITLGILALVKHSRARRLAQAEPRAYEPVPSTGLVTGIIGLVLSVVVALPATGVVAAVAIPAYLGYRDRAREQAVMANLETVRRRAEEEVQAIHAKAPGQVPSQDAVIRGLAADPAILALRNPYAPSQPALKLGEEGPLGTILVHPETEQAEGVTTWSVRLRVRIRRNGEERWLGVAVTTHTQEQTRGRTEDGWEVVAPPAEAEPAPTAPEPPTQG